ncbi:MAG: aldo/keto reductase [Methylobacterium sp.]|nr:aldo/keto reductase [Methylobacterium sp.]
MEPETHTLDLFPLGLGLVNLGRSWGHVQKPPPPEAEARRLLEAAFDLGIQVYDTAPAYGLSEARLGAFLKSLTKEQRETIFIATKFGEHWNDDGTTRVDHSYEALMRSLDRSVELLGDIDLLQVHKASMEALRGEELRWALQAVQAMDIPQFGASVSDMEAGKLALEMGFHWIQMPLNAQNRALEPLVEIAEAAGTRIIANRPLAMGAAVADLPADAREQRVLDAFRYLRQANPSGLVLTGTTSPEHMHQNIAAFRAAE